VHGYLKTKRGRKLAYIIGVHLKAQDYSAEVRYKQVTTLARYIRDKDPEVPIILTGDFNTHGEDLQEFNRIFSRYRTPIRHVRNPWPYTYRTVENAQKFDRFWIDRDIDVLEKMYVSAPCADWETENDPMYQLSKYNRYISDHCPVTLRMDL